MGIVTVAELRKLFGTRTAYDLNEVARGMDRRIVRMGFTTPLHVQHFLAQIAHESAGLKATRENLNYSAAAIMRVFGVGKHSARVTADEAKQLARNPQALAERVYGLGNPKKAKELGNTNPGDAFKFRGAFPLQITGKRNITEIGKKLGYDFVRDPSLIDRGDVAILASARWFADRCLRAAALDDIVAVTKIVNGGQNGLEDRKKWLAKVKRVLPADVLEARLSSVERVAARESFTDLTDDQVAIIQAKLSELNYFAGRADGVYGPRTREAIRAFQDDVGIEVTGELDEDTKLALVAARPREPRNISERDLRESGSETIASVDKLKAAGVAVAAGSGATGAADVLDQAKDLVDQGSAYRWLVEDAVDLLKWVTSNWWVLALVAGIAVYFIGRKIAKRRVHDAQTGAHIGR